MYFPVKTLGPGNRIGLWTVGCPHGCYRCCNPELWERNIDKDISTESLLRMIQRINTEFRVDGVTISGGDPFEQAQELEKLVHGIHLSITDDILIYTGYSLTQLKNMENTAVDKVLETIAVLIDGKYIHNANDNEPLRGSWNQQIHILNPAFRSKYDAYLTQPRQVQNVFYQKDLLTIGIPMKEEE